MTEITDLQKSQIVFLRGIGCDGEYIAEQVGISTSTLFSYLNEWEEQAKASDAPVSEVAGPLIMAGVFGEANADVSSLLFGSLNP